MIFQSLSPFDAQWLAELHAQEFDPSWSDQSFAELLQSPSVQGWYGQNDQGPGFIMVQQAADQGEILTFQVAELARGKGLGAALLSYSVAKLRECDVKNIYLEVRGDRESAKKTL